MAPRCAGWGGYDLYVCRPSGRQPRFRPLGDRQLCFRYTRFGRCTLDDLAVEDFVAESHESGLAVTFPHQSGNHDLRMVFDAAILRYETVF